MTVEPYPPEPPQPTPPVNQDESNSGLELTTYPLGHHDLMDPRDIATIEEWGPCG